MNSPRSRQTPGSQPAGSASAPLAVQTPATRKARPTGSIPHEHGLAEAPPRASAPAGIAPEILSPPTNANILEAAERYYNRELSWLQFNRRVLEEAGNANHPLLERLRFLSISGSNLDEFYMVRVAGIHGQILAHVETVSQDGLTPSQQLAAINGAVAQLSADQQARWTSIKTELHAARIRIVEAGDLRPDERTWLQQTFLARVFPLLTPIAVDPAHSFPFIPNKGFAVALEMTRKSDNRTMMALVPIPPQLERFMRLPGPGEPGSRASGADIRFIRIETVVSLFIDRLFSGFEVVDQGAFRLLRDSDI